MDRAEREQLLQRLRADAARIADHFGLEYRTIEAEHPRVKSRYGVCYDTGLVKIRLNHARTGKPLKYSSLIDTLCHELAHLRHFNHGPEFKAFFLRLLGWARKEGIYQPAPRRRRSSSFAPSSPSARPSPARRNGVPVFSASPPSSSKVLPWERHPGHRDEKQAVAADVAAIVRPVPVEVVPSSKPQQNPPRQPGPRQLRLFDC
jgi:hypothetical protein